MAGKVGDTITANVTPDKATNVTYAWYTGDSATALNTQISGADKKDLTVTADMLGKFVGVVVSGDNNSSANAVTAVAVAEADAADIRLIEAKQSGAKTIALTFSNPITADDVITVKKGNNTVAIDGKPDYAVDFKTATITLADKITASSEYTVTLTPKDTKIKASEAKFVGETSELKEIKFLNKVLVMKDTKYDEGYAYAKGYDQFGGEVTLSGLNVTSGVGSFTAYDSATGKITITATGTTPFMLIKEVPVFIQYQQGNQMITANEILTVSTQAYVSEVEFGEIGKDGTMRDDKRLTASELGSQKYYVELKTVKDQYGNTLSADDLNTQKNNATNPTLFVIPGNTGAFYTTGDFGTVDKKTVLWLGAPATGAKPGTMALTITGAGGKTFTKDVTIEDDPYIETLTVTYPDLYADNKESAAMEFSAIDQYGNALTMWDVRPTAETAANVSPAVNNGGTYLVFGDKNHMTGNATTVAVGGTGIKFNKVTDNSAKKTFTVTLDTTGATAKNMATFTITSAGMKVATHSITIGEQGTAAKVKTTIDGDRQLTSAKGDNQSFNFNEKVQFEDANGNTMNRMKSADYPIFINMDGNKVEKSDSTIKNSDYTNFYWSLHKVTNTVKKIEEDTTIAAGTCDTDGVVTFGDLTASKADYYVTVYGKTAANKYYKLNDAMFHFTGVSGADKTYTASADDLLYAKRGIRHSVEVKVKAITDNGETYTVNPNRVSVVAGGDFTGSGNKLYATLATDYADNTNGTYTAQVYVDNKDVTTVDVKYSNALPVATSTEFKFDVTTAGSNNASKVGATFDGDVVGEEFTAGTNVFLWGDGVLKINGANTLGDSFTAKIKDQYGRAMDDAKLTMDGKSITAGSVISAARHVFQLSGGTKNVKFYMTTSGTTVQGSSSIVTTAGDLNAALADSNYSTVTFNAANLAANVNVPAGKTLVIGAGLDTNGKTITVNGKLVIGSGATLASDNDAVTINNTGSIEVLGEWTAAKSAAVTITNDGTVYGSGTASFGTGTGANVATLAGTGTWNITGATLKLVNAKFGDAAKLAGHVAIGKVDFDGKNVVLKDDLQIDMGTEEIGGAAAAANLSNSNALVVEKGAEVVVKTSDGQVQTVKNDTAENAPGTKIDASGISGATLTTAGRTMSKVTLIQSGTPDGSSINYDNWVSGASLSNPAYSWDAENKTATYTYKFTGTLKYNASLNGYGSDWHWGIGCMCPTKTAAGATKVEIGKNMTAGTTAPVDGWVNASDDTVGDFSRGFKTTTIQDFVIRYTFEDGSKVDHVIDLSSATVESAPEA